MAMLVYRRVASRVESIWMPLLVMSCVFDPIGYGIGMGKLLGPCTFRPIGQCRISAIKNVLYLYMDVSKNSGTPKWMVYNGKPC